MVQSGSKRFDFCRKCINFSPAGGCGSGLHGSEFPHHIHGRVQCLHLLHVLPAHRVLFPVLEAEHQRADSPARASHTHGLDSDSGFWIRIRIGLDYGRICHPSAIICHHLLSSAVRRPPVQNSSCESACKRCKRCKSQLKAVSHPDRQDRTEKNTAHPNKSGEL